MGFDSVESVRAGKFIEVRLNDEDEEVAAENVRQMCDKLLANPIIEDYSFELERIGED